MGNAEGGHAHLWRLECEKPLDSSASERALCFRFERTGLGLEATPTCMP